MIYNVLHVSSIILWILLQWTAGLRFVPGKGCGVEKEITTIKGPVLQAQLKPCGVVGSGTSVEQKIEDGKSLFVKYIFFNNPKTLVPMHTITWDYLILDLKRNHVHA